jgi:hypothetical protein
MPHRRDQEVRQIDGAYLHAGADLGGLERGVAAAQPVTAVGAPGEVIWFPDVRVALAKDGGWSRQTAVLSNDRDDVRP